MATKSKTSKASKASKAAVSALTRPILGAFPSDADTGRPTRRKLMSDLRPTAAERTLPVPGTERPAAPALDILSGAPRGEGDHITGERIMVARHLLSVSPSNPRKTYDDAGVKRLADSIRENGMLHPLSVTPAVDATGKRYVLAGSRRLRALDMLGEENVPCIETTAAPWQVSGVENEDRQDVPWADMTDYLCTLRDLGLTYKQIGEKIGRSEASVQRAMQAVKRLDPALYDASRKVPGCGSFLMTLAERETDHARQAEAWAKYLADGGGTGKTGRRKGSKNAPKQGPKRASQSEARKMREVVALALAGRDVEPLEAPVNTTGEQDAYIAGIIVGLDLGNGVIAPGDLPQWVHGRIDAVRKAAAALARGSRKPKAESQAAE